MYVNPQMLVVMVWGGIDICTHAYTHTCVWGGGGGGGGCGGGERRDRGQENTYPRTNFTPPPHTSPHAHTLIYPGSRARIRQHTGTCFCVGVGTVVHGAHEAKGIGNDIEETPPSYSC